MIKNKTTNRIRTPGGAGEAYSGGMPAEPAQVHRVTRISTARAWGLTAPKLGRLTHPPSVGQSNSLQRDHTGQNNKDVQGLPCIRSVFDETGPNVRFRFKQRAKVSITKSPGQAVAMVTWSGCGRCHLSLVSSVRCSVKTLSRIGS